MDFIARPNEEPVAEPSNPLEHDYTNLGRAAIGQGLGLGWGDEAEAWLRSKLTNRPMDEVHQEIKNSYAQYALKNPVTSAAAEFGGAFIPTVVGAIAEPFTGGASTPVTIAGGLRTAGALSKLKAAYEASPYFRSAVTGGVTGGVAGAGGAEEGERLQQGAIGSVLGTGLGVAIPAAIKGGSEVVDWAKGKLGPSAEYIKDKAAGYLARTGVTPEEILARKTADEAQGLPSSIINADRDLMALGEEAAKRSKSASNILEDTLENRQKGSRELVVGKNKEFIGGGNYYEDLDAINNELKAKAEPLYDKAREFGVVDDPEVLKFFKLPQFKKAINETEELLAANGEKLPTRKRIDLETGKITSEPVYNVEALHNIKMGLDSLIEKETDALTGKKTSLGNVYKNKQKEFLNALDEAVPDYKEARKFYSGKMDLADALNKGRDEFKTWDHEQVAKYVKGLNDGEKEAFKTGVLRDLYGNVMDPEKVNAAQRIIGSPENEKKLKALFDSPAKFELYKNSLQREAQLFHETNKFLQSTGNPKFKDSNQAGEFIADTFTGGPQQGIAKQVLRWISDPNMDDKTAKQVAKMLASKEPTEVAAAVKAIEDYSAKAAQKSEGLHDFARTTVRGINETLPPAPMVQTEQKEKSARANDFESALTRKKEQVQSVNPAFEEALKKNRER
jgi:hypothetical protein